jgi:hypothetical protein
MEHSMENDRTDNEPITEAEQARAATLLRMTEDVVAPASLHAAVHGMTSRAPRHRSWLRGRVFAPAMVAAGVIVVAIVVALAGGGHAPTVAQTARLAIAPATAAAPTQDVSDRALLDVRQAGIPFPSYLKGAGWTPSGVRRDTLHGRAVTTVFYTSPGGGRVGYAIVGGAALGVPSGSTTTIGGVRYVLARAGGTRLVTWRRAGHTCVIAGRSVSPGTLLALARSDEQTT